MIYNIELQWISRLQEMIRSPFWDQFFILWNYVDSFSVVYIIIAAVWYLVNRTIGIRIFYLFILSWLVSELLKSLFHLPRPCQLDPTLGIICPKTLGFPSGVAQTATLYAGLLIIECRQRIIQLLGILFSLTYCFSRVYLGAHFPTDILGGIFVGGILLLVYAKIFPLFSPYSRLLSFLFPFAALLFWKELQFGILLGVAIGLLIYDLMKIKPTNRWSFRIASFIFAVSGILLLLNLGAFFPPLTIVLSIASGLWFSTIGVWCKPKTIDHR